MMKPFEIIVRWTGRKGEFLGNLTTACMIENIQEAYQFSQWWMNEFLRDIYHGSFALLQVEEIFDGHLASTNHTTGEIDWMTI